jgi:hypothetical protein
MYLEFPSVLKYFRDYVEASGGIFELKKALDWSVWYAAKWWREIHSAGAVNLKKPFVKALYLSLLAKRIIDEDGKVVKEVKKPELPKGLYAREWVEMHQQFDELGAVKVARDEVDRNSLDLLFSDIQAMGWHRLMVNWLLKGLRRVRGTRRVGAVLQGGSPGTALPRGLQTGGLLRLRPQPLFSRGC